MTAQWLPVENSFELQLLDRLVGEGRRFIKCLQYNLGGGPLLATAVLLDTVPSPCALYIIPSEVTEAAAKERRSADEMAGLGSWTWQASRSSISELPAANAYVPNS